MSDAHLTVPHQSHIRWVNENSDAPLPHAPEMPLDSEEESAVASD